MLFGNRMGIWREARENLIYESDSDPEGDFPERGDFDPQQARTWLSDCLGKHEICSYRPGGQQRTLPSRLIFCGDSTTACTPKLCEGRDIPEDVSFVTLSHCWGGKVICCLESRNLDSFKSGLPMSLLSKTFLDAFTVTRELGFAYIWIDSLCIIQDSSEDWERESSKMSDIYANGILNIAATGFPNGERGFLTSRDPSLLQSPARERTHADFYREWGRGVESAPLNRRCWVLQERVLSP
ncbi:hypothetical protein DL769_006316 [Monosporascus sp. CRB-8-3]|nr:hypothetical protein DL769_006316 [Monosporascus sp. CRB-8-3]